MQADTIGSRALCVPPMGAATQVPTCQAQHWLHVYRCSQTRLKAYSCSPAKLQVQTCRCPQARLQVHRCRRPGSGHAGARRPGSRCNHAGTRRPCSRCKLAGAYHRPGSRCAGASRLGSRFIRADRMGSGSVYTYPPPVTRPNPWARTSTQSSHSQCRPGPKSG